EILGRFLNYGSVHLDSRFVRDMILPSIADPYRFLKALNEARSELKDESMHIVLEGQHSNHKIGQALQSRMQGNDQASAPEEPPTPQMHDKKYAALSENPLKEMGEVMDETVQSTDDVLNHYKNQKA